MDANSAAAWPNLLMLAGAVLWIFLAIMAAYVATERGRSGVGFFFFALFLSYLLAIVTLIALPARKDDESDSAD